MKKKSLILLLIILVCISAFIFVACDGKEEETPLTHNFAEEWSSDTVNHWHACTIGNCAEKRDVAAHDLEWRVTANASCDQAGTKALVCKVCGYQSTSTTIAATGHNVTDISEKSATLVPGTGTCECSVIYQGTCTTCTRIVELAPVTEYRHSFYNEVASEPTCIADGVKHVHCSNENCMYSKTRGAFSTSSFSGNNPAHNWQLESENNGIKNYQCPTCSATKQVVEFTTVATLDSVKNDIADVEIKMDNAAIQFDSNIGSNLESRSNINLTVSTLDDTSRESAIGQLPSDKKALLGDAEIFDFNLVAGDLQIHELGGTAKVRVPYTLKEGEDPDNLVVWYINGEEIESLDATYCNGEVEFETSHFSSFGVSQLTAPEYCAKYGHPATEQNTIAATCTADGFVKCLHCNTVLEVLTGGHTFEEEISLQPTCTTDGIKHCVCTVCNYANDIAIQATGHISDVQAGYQHDEQYHWYLCSVCGTALQKELHYMLDPSESSCSACGYSVPVVNITISLFVNDETKCYHGELRDISLSVASGLTLQEFLTMTVSDSDMEAYLNDVSRITCNGKEISFETKLVDGGVYKLFATTDTPCMYTGEHNYEIIEQTQATCTTDGNVTRRCRNCGNQYSMGSYAQGHKYVRNQEGKWICTACQEQCTDLKEITLSLSFEDGERVVIDGIKEYNCSRITMYIPRVYAAHNFLEAFELHDFYYADMGYLYSFAIGGQEYDIRQVYYDSYVPTEIPANSVISFNFGCESGMIENDPQAFESFIAIIQTFGEYQMRID